MYEASCAALRGSARSHSRQSRIVFAKSAIFGVPRRGGRFKGAPRDRFSARCDSPEMTTVIEHPAIDQAIGAVYRRELPGGGYVAIRVEREREYSRTRVCVERRAREARREGHVPVVIAEADGDDRSPAFGDLYRIASDNAAIARALLEIEGPQPDD